MMIKFILAFFMFFTADAAFVHLPQSGGSVTVDTAITDGSTNPVTNNAIFDALALKYNSSDATTALAAKQAIYDPTIDIDRVYVILCDFVEDDRCTWSAASAAGGGSGQGVSASTTGMNATENSLGVIDLITGTGATARAAIVTAGNLRLGSQALELVSRATVSALSDGTNTYTISIGFIDSTGSGDSTDGLYFRYNSGVNSGKYECVTADGGSIAAVDSGLSPTATVNEAGTSVSFFINGASVCGSPITGAGLPDTGDFFVMGAKIEKTLGATSRTFSVDYFGLKATRSTAR
jgi:hypothetical protein